MGAGILLNVTPTPLSIGGNVAVEKLAPVVISADVKIATRDPGATGDPAPFTEAKLAAFTMPPVRIDG